MKPPRAGRALHVSSTLAPALFLVLASAASAAASLSWSSVAHAGEIQIATGPGGGASTWRGDGQLSQGLRLGYRFGDLVAIDSVSRLGYAAVDERVITYLSLGGTLYGRLGRTRPYVRLAFVHQHEEPLPGYREDPFGAVFGVGDGIRHRGGFGTSLGLDVPVQKWKRTELVLGIDATASYFPDPRGPQLYAGGSLWLGFNFDIGARKE